MQEQGIWRSGARQEMSHRFGVSLWRLVHLALTPGG